MRYLFFDIESAIGTFGCICEFGYVITNENLEVIEQKNIYINPKRKFNDRILSFLSKEKEFYEAQESFASYYKEIRNVLLSADKIFGFAVSNDVKFINDDCLRTGKRKIDFDFYDIQKIVKEYEEASNMMSLEKTLEKYNIKSIGEMHNAVNDAFNTMQILKCILIQSSLTIEELLKLFPASKGKNIDGKLEQDNKITIIEKITKYISTNKVSEKKHKKLINEFLTKFKHVDLVAPILFGKKICFSKIFEINYFKKTILLIKLIKEYGGEYVTKASECNIFIPHLNDKKCSRMITVENINRNNGNIEIMKMSQLLEIFNVDENYLEKTDLSIIKIQESKGLFKNIKEIEKSLEIYFSDSIMHN